MKLIQHTRTIPENDYIRRYFANNTAFFDIETTGFSQKNSFVYLIGLSVRRENEIHILQFLAENRSDEPKILRAFQEALTKVHTLITFNGLGFDLPFLKARESLYSIDGNWNRFQYLDLYKLTAKLSHLFQLPDKKQKSVEKFLGISREDTYSGKELIAIYHTYEKQQNPESERLLLLHNYEDVWGMAELLALLAYRDFYESPVKIQQASVNSYLPYGADTKAQELLLTLQAPVRFPRQVLYQSDFFSLMCKDATVCLSVKIFHGELRFYYDNYKDYYYLLDEDMAIHKSVAVFVDSKHRKKATASTCYAKRKGDFLPQKELLFTPAFYPGKKEKLSYFEFQENMLSDFDALSLYCTHLLKLCQ